MHRRFLCALLGAFLFLGPVLEADQLGLKHAIGLAERSLASGDHDKARLLIQRALERDRKSRAVWALRTRWAKEVGDEDELLYSLHQELRLAEAQRADRSEVKALRERVLELDPIAADLFAMKDGFQEKLLRIAKAYEKSERPHAAIRTYKKILSLDPENAASREAIERIASTPDPSLAGDAKPKDLFEDVSREWIAEFDAEHADWKSRGQLERENYVTHTDAGYEIMVRSGEAMEQMNAFYRQFFRYGTEEYGGSVPRIDLRIFATRDEYLELGTGPPVEWSAGQFTGAAVETYVGESGFEGMTGTLFHEAAHQFVGLATNATGWLNEGLASFFEGTRILANGTVIMNMPANHRLFPLANRMDRGWMATFDDGFDPDDNTATPDKAPTFRIVLENRYDWGPPWYAPTWGLVYFLYNYQDLIDGRFVYRDAFQEFIDSSGGRIGEGAVGNFEKVVLANPSKPYKHVEREGKATTKHLPKTADDLDALWKKWTLELRDEQQGKLEVARPYANWGRYAVLNKDYVIAKEHFEKGMIQEPHDAEMLLDFANLLEDRFDNEDRAARLVTDALRVLEAANEPDPKRIREVERMLAKLDPKLESLTDVQDKMAAAARSLVARYQAGGRTLMVMDLAWRMGSELELPDLFDSYREAVERGGKSLRIWELAYNEQSLEGWSTPGPASAFSADGSAIKARKGKYDPDNFDYQVLTLDKVTSGDFSLQAEILATRGKVNFCGFVFGQKSGQSFHGLALFPGKGKTQAGLAGTGFVELFSFFGNEPKTWRRTPVDTRASNDRSATARWHELRLDVSGRNVDLWFDGEFLATHEFPSRDVLRGKFGLIMGSGEARFRNIRYLSIDARDPVAGVERDLRLEKLRAESGGSLGGSFQGMIPPFPKVGRWLQGGRSNWEEKGSVPQVLLLFSIEQNDLVRVDEWLTAFAPATEEYGLEIICLASANDNDALEEYLKDHPLPGHVGIDAREAIGLGDTFEEYSVERFNLPRIILLDLDHKVTWEGDPGFSAARVWKQGEGSSLDSFWDLMVDKRKLEELAGWKRIWLARALPQLVQGDLASAADVLKEADDYDARFSADVAKAASYFNAIAASVAALESTSNSFERDGAGAAVIALLEWAKLIDQVVPAKKRKQLKAVIENEDAKQWGKAEKALAQYLAKKKRTPAMASILTRKLSSLDGRFVREAETLLSEALATDDLEAFDQAALQATQLLDQWLASEFFHFEE